MLSQLHTQQSFIYLLLFLYWTTTQLSWTIVLESYKSHKQCMEYSSTSYKTEISDFSSLLNKYPCRQSQWCLFSVFEVSSVCNCSQSLFSLLLLLLLLPLWVILPTCLFLCSPIHLYLFAPISLPLIISIKLKHLDMIRGQETKCLNNIQLYKPYGLVFIPIWKITIYCYVRNNLSIAAKSIDLISEVISPLNVTIHRGLEWPL